MRQRKIRHLSELFWIFTERYLKVGLMREISQICVNRGDSISRLTDVHKFRSNFTSRFSSSLWAVQMSLIFITQDEEK